MARYFECTEGGSNKFWQIELDGSEFTTRWGPINEAGQQKTKGFDSPAAAKKAHDALVASKLKKGYRELGTPALSPPRRAKKPTTGPRKLITVRLESADQWRELVLDGDTLKQTVGRVSSDEPPQISRERHESVDDANDMLERLVSVYRRQGLREALRRVEEVSDEEDEVLRERMADNPELEAACLGVPDSPEPWAVYTDWLEAQGDVRAQLAQKLLAAQGPELAPHQHAVVWGEQLVDALARGEVKDLVAKFGFYRSAGLRLANESSASLDGLTRAFLAQPVTRFVTALRFGLASTEAQANDWGPTLEALLEAPHARDLRELRFNDYTWNDLEISWAPMGDFSRVWKGLPSLELLHLRSGGGGALGVIDAPRLKTFIRESGGLSKEELDSIVNAKWPSLEWLEVWTGSSDYNAEATLDTFTPLLAARGLPKLRRLGLVNCEHTVALISKLARSRVLPQLEVLDLSKGVLSDDDVDELIAHASAFKHLVKLDLSQNVIDTRLDEVRAALPNAVLDEQRDDYGPDERYVAVGE